MNTINAAAIANSYLAGDIDTRRGHAMRSYFKRQSRRQARHRLATELRMNMGHHLAEAEEMMPMRAGDVDRNPVMASTATIIAFPSQEQRAARSVLVVRKSARSPFERKQVHVELLAAWSLNRKIAAIIVANVGITQKTQLWQRGYRHGNQSDHQSEILLDMPLEYYEGVAEGVRDWGFDCFPDYYP